MDRVIVYPGQVVEDTDLLRAGRCGKVMLSTLLAQLYGGASVTPSAYAYGATTSSTDMTITFSKGSVNGAGELDVTAIGGNGGGLPADGTPASVQYITNASTVLTFSAGSTTTVYAVCQEIDTDNTVPAFYNSANPSQTLAGVGNSGADLPTCRSAVATLVASSTAPATPTGGAVVPLYTVTVPSGATNTAGATVTALTAFYLTIPQLQAKINSLLSASSLTFTRTIQTAGNAGSGAAALSGTFTAPMTGRIRVVIRSAGGGGGAGGGSTSSQIGAGGGGGGGAYAEFFLSVSAGDVISYVLGAAGVAGVNNGSSGTTGSSSTVSVNGVLMCTLTGGAGGINSGEGAVGQGGGGGSVSWSNGHGGIAYAGAGGGYGVYISGSQGLGGIGGVAWGTVGGSQVTGAQQNGVNASLPGGGGSGGLGTGAGGNGGPAEIIIQY